MTEASLYWGQLAKVSSVINWGNPLPLVINSIKTNNSSQLSSIRYMTIVSTQIAWTLYGIQSQNNTVKTVSIAGSIVFYIYSIISTYLRKEFEMLFGFNIFIILQYFVINQFSTELLGFTCSLVQCIAAMTPIDIILKSIKNRDKSLLNPFSIILNLPCCFLWSGYGLSLNEFVIFLPNFIEFVLVFIQALLFVGYTVYGNVLKQQSLQNIKVKNKGNAFIAIPDNFAKNYQDQQDNNNDNQQNIVIRQQIQNNINEQQQQEYGDLEQEPLFPKKQI